MFQSVQRLGYGVDDHELDFWQRQTVFLCSRMFRMAPRPKQPPMSPLRCLFLGAEATKAQR